MPKIENLKKIHLVDSFIIFLNLSNSYSIIPYLLFFQYHRGINTGIIFIINAIYLLYRFKQNIKIPINLLFGIYFVLNLVNIFSGIYTSTGTYMTWLYLLSNGTFFFILYNCYLDYSKRESEKRALWLVFRGYIWLCVICIISAITLFLLIKCGLNPYVNLVNERMDLFHDNVNTLGHTYYFPYYISTLLVSSSVSLKIPFFTESGIVCGIYYEPHILTFILFPALFILWGYIQSSLNKFLLLLIWVWIMLIALSTTNIIIFLCCLSIMLFFSKKGKFWLIPMSFLLCLLIFYIGLENTEFFFVLNKLEETGGSKGYTLETINFAFTPRTLFGSNFINNNYLNDITTVRRDVGYISFVLNVIFLIVFVFRILKSFWAGRFHCLLGVGVLYFFLHSMKIAMVTYSLSILMFMIFIITLAAEKNKEYDA